MKNNSIFLSLLTIFFFSSGPVNADVSRNGNPNQSIFFIEDQKTLSHVEDILLDTTISDITEDVVLGHVNLSAFDAIKAGDQLYLSLPGFKHQIELSLKAYDNPMETVTTYSGTVAGYDHSEFIISVQHEKLLGTIKFDNYVFIIEPTSADDNRHVIHSANVDLLSPGSGGHIHEKHSTDHHSSTAHAHNSTTHNHESFSSEVKNSQTPKTGAARSANGAVSVLFLHARDVANADMKASQIVMEFNNALDRSQVSLNNRIFAAGSSQELDADFAGMNLPEILGEFTSKTTVFSDLDIRMQAVGADVALLLVSANTGLEGGIVAKIFNPSEPVAISVDLYALGDYTALHELGHIFGGAHALPLIPQENDSPFLQGHGFELDGFFQTIMGGYNSGLPGDQRECMFTSLSSPTRLCQRLAYFSNPEVELIPNIPITALGDAATADMETVLESTMPQVSNWGTLSPPVYNEPTRGFAHDPIRGDHGIHISKSGLNYLLYFYTFNAFGIPEWFISTIPISSYQNNYLYGTLQRVTYNAQNQSLAFSTVGSFALDYRMSSVNATPSCDGVNRKSRPAVFSWSIDGQNNYNLNDRWCMQSMFKVSASNLSPALVQGGSGVWYEPGLNGWGLSFQFEAADNEGASYRAVVYYYDQYGFARWSVAEDYERRTQNNTNRYSTNLLTHILGYPRSSINGIVTPTLIGSLNLYFGQNGGGVIGATGSASVMANHTGVPPISWVRTNVGITKLAN